MRDDFINVDLCVHVQPEKMGNIKKKKTPKIAQTYLLFQFMSHTQRQWNEQKNCVHLVTAHAAVTLKTPGIMKMKRSGMQRAKLVAVKTNGTTGFLSSAFFHNAPHTHRRNNHTVTNDYGANGCKMDCTRIMWFGSLLFFFFVSHFEPAGVCECSYVQYTGFLSFRKFFFFFLALFIILCLARVCLPLSGASERNKEQAMDLRLNIEQKKSKKQMRYFRNGALTLKRTHTNTQTHAVHLVESLND